MSTCNVQIGTPAIVMRAPNVCRILCTLPVSPAFPLADSHSLVDSRDRQWDQLIRYQPLQAVECCLVQAHRASRSKLRRPLMLCGVLAVVGFDRLDVNHLPILHV
jgi:hypothetical protein